MSSIEIEEYTEYPEESQRVSSSGSTYILTGMYKSWFVNYASYVILERAVPHIADGLKPVQRRILYTMSQMDDRLIKVANIVGFSMQLHPHGDASISDALVQLGQKDILIQCQGNWGNILTGDGAAAARYIEARLTPFAKEVLFSPKITEYRPSYDGANKEPVRLPVKFPLLLAQGVEGIAVGLSSKILPHNVSEILQACISHLKGETFRLYPDFQTGGHIDVSKYNDGERGGNVKVRANIIKKDSKTLVIDELPFGKTTSSLIDSILKANERGKIRIRKVDDKTSEKANIEIQLAPGTSSDKTIDALYAFTDCEISISPNCCVIKDDKPVFVSVSDVLKDNVERTKNHLHAELQVEYDELREKHLFAYLEQLFIKKRVYKDKKFEEAKSTEEAVAYIRTALAKELKDLVRPVTDEDLKRLLEIRMARILRFNEEKNQILLESLLKEMELVRYRMDHIVEYTIEWYSSLLEKYGAKYPRRTKVRSFDTIEASKVVEKNEKLYVNRQEGFIGTALKKDEFVCNISDIDDIIVFFKDARYIITKVAEKAFVGKDIIHVARFVKNDKRTVYNTIHREGKHGHYFIKRFSVTSFMRDRDYPVGYGGEGSKFVYFSANPNGEAETVRVVLKPKPSQRQLVFEKDFSSIRIMGRSSRGYLLTKGDVHKIVLKQKGVSTLGGRMVWFDHDVNRINYDERGAFLGEFFPEDKILVIRQNGEIYTTSFSDTNHFENDIFIIEKYDPNKVWTLIYFDSEQGYTYIKRFQVEDSAKRENILGEGCEMITLSDESYPLFEVSFKGKDQHRLPVVIDVEEYIAVKGIRAKGKRLSTFEVGDIEEKEGRKEEVATEDEEVSSLEDSASDDNEEFMETNRLLGEATGMKSIPFGNETEEKEVEE